MVSPDPGIAATEAIADLHQAHQPGALVQLAAEIVQIQLTGFGDADMAQHTSGALRQELPGHQVAVVLHQREQNLITGAQIVITPAAGDEMIASLALRVNTISLALAAPTKRAALRGRPRTIR